MRSLATLILALLSALLTTTATPAPMKATIASATMISISENPAARCRLRGAPSMRGAVTRLSHLRNERIMFDLPLVIVLGTLKGFRTSRDALGRAKPVLPRRDHLLN